VSARDRDRPHQRPLTGSGQVPRVRAFAIQHRNPQRVVHPAVTAPRRSPRSPRLPRSPRAQRDPSTRHHTSELKGNFGLAVVGGCSRFQRRRRSEREIA